MSATNANIDYCGIRNLLRLLSGQGFTETELKKIAARIASSTGANIISSPKAGIVVANTQLKYQVRRNPQ